MNTPICDFVRRYAESGTARLHMPGHKGRGPLGVEALDITEVAGADSLYEAEGIIRESEKNASALFGCPTYYSTEGSSHAIRAMLYLTLQYANASGRSALVWAARNVHKTFLTAIALLDVEVRWLYDTDRSSYLCCVLDAAQLEAELSAAEQRPTALYVTSPDYLGNVADISALAEVCHRYGVLLLVDNAHGAYLHFLPKSQHPVALGADACADSAHKTLPVLTGGAYLHVSPRAPECFTRLAKTALSLFGSTSPSYLILQSLDAANPYLATEFPARLAALLARVESMRRRLLAAGYTCLGSEALKVTLDVKDYGYGGDELATLLRKAGVECEFCDADALVLMLSPSLTEEELDRLEGALLSVKRRTSIRTKPPRLATPERVVSPRAAMLSDYEELPVADCFGRVLAVATVSCPPAVPVLMAGERINEDALRCLTYYGVKSCCVIKEG